MAQDMMVITGPIGYKSESLAKADANIRGCIEAMGRSAESVALEVSRVADSPSMLKEDGYRNVAEWCATAFGFKKSYTYQLIKVAKKCLLGGYDHDDTGEKFSISQMVEICNLDAPVLHKLVDEGKVDAGMTIREIREVVRAESPEGKAKLPATAPSPSTSPSSSPSSATPQPPSTSPSQSRDTPEDIPDMEYKLQAMISGVRGYLDAHEDMNVAAYLVLMAVMERLEECGHKDAGDITWEAAKAMEALVKKGKEKFQ